jgi:5-methylcytosine-specific restriction endonuclease McrA
MADFPDSVKQQALARAGKRCECARYICLHHNSRCERIFGLQAHHITQGGPNTLENCEILCDACHQNKHSFGQREDTVSEPSEVPHDG